MPGRFRTGVYGLDPLGVNPDWPHRDGLIWPHRSWNAKYTLAELEEQNQSLNRLRRWCRDLRRSDLLKSLPAHDAAIDLKECDERFNSYTEAVYASLGTYPAATRGQ